MTASRIIAIAALALAVGLYALGHFVDSPEAYLFPRLIAIAMGLFGLALLVTTWSASASLEKDAIGTVPWATLLPALVLFVLFLLVAEELGFYVSAFVAFLALVSYYAPDRVTLRGWVNRIAVSLLFTGAIYSLFGLLLKVQTPRGILI